MNIDGRTFSLEASASKEELELFVSTPIPGIEFLKFEDDQDARTAFWHSSAHVLGEALERLYGSRLTVGPPLAGGFYYDSYMGDGTADGALKEDDCECLL